MRLKPIYTDGPWKCYAISTGSGRCQVFQGLSDSPPKTAQKMLALIKRACSDQRGPMVLPSDRCHAIEPGHGIRQFRTDNLRILWFIDKTNDRVIICASFFQKKTRKTPPMEKERAIELKKSFFRHIEENGYPEVDDE